jgi:cation:H+ antiporter
VAILFGGQRAGREIGIGAILGAPLMLTTLAMFVLGVAVLGFARQGRRSARVLGDPTVLRHDLGYFLAMYALALAAGVIHLRAFKWTLAVVLVVGYGFYVKRHFESPATVTTEIEAKGEIRPLYLRRGARRLARRPVEDPPRPPRWASVAQCAVSLVGILVGARVFVFGVEGVSRTFHVPQLALALLIAPLATELPEKFNSVIWIRRRKDTLALGNLTGAMVFQSSFPVTVGLLLTPWRLTGEALVAAIVALGAGSVLWITVRLRGELGARLLLAQGAIYAGYVAYVLARL